MMTSEVGCKGPDDEDRCFNPDQHLGNFDSVGADNEHDNHGEDSCGSKVENRRTITPVPNTDESWIIVDKFVWIGNEDLAMVCHLDNVRQEAEKK